LEIQIPQPELFTTAEGNFFRSFLIGTKPNDANWFVRRETGHDKVQSALERNFAIIPELIQKPISEGGGGHYKGTRDQILKAYADNSHGKIVKLLGPFYYQDSPEDYWYDQITKLSNSRSASVLHSEGQKTWNGYDVSPHIFVNKGSDEKGWEDWEFAGLNLVIRGAFGPQAIITKFCNGTESKCFKDLVASSSNTNDETIAEILTSHLSKIASTPHSMPDQPPAKPDTGTPDTGLTNKDKTNPTTDPQKGLTNAPKVEDKITLTKEEYDKILERADSFTDMENERKTEVLEKIFSLYKDEEERKKEIKDYSKLDMKTVKMLKLFHEKITPRIEDKVRAELKAEAKEAEQKDDKKADDKKDKKEERSASSLDKEPKIKFHSPNDKGEEEKDRSASVPEIRNEAYLLRQKLSRGRNSE
jgi:hypothetical protein